MGNFQSNFVAVVTMRQFIGNGGQQVTGFFGVNCQITVTGDAELVTTFDFHTEKQVIGESMNNR